MWTFSHQSPGYFSIRPLCLRVPNFEIFCTTKSKTQIFSTPSSSFDRSAKNPYATKIGSRVAPCRNNEPCLTTQECPGFRHHPHEMAEFLSPLLLLFLRFIDFSAALKHCRNASTAFTFMRAGRRTGHSIGFGLVHALIIDCVPRAGGSARLWHSSDCSTPVHNYFLKNLY